MFTVFTLEMVLKSHSSVTLGKTAVYIHCSDILGDRSSSSWYSSFSQKISLKRLICDPGEDCYMLSSFRSPRRQSSSSQYGNLNWSIVLKRLVLMVTQGKTLHIHCSGLPGDIAHWVNMVVLLGRWSWEGHMLMTFGKNIHSLSWSSRRENLLSPYASFTWRIVLKRSFISHTGEYLALHVQYSDLTGDNMNRNQYDNFIWKMVLKKPFVGGTGDDCMFIVQVSQETELTELIWWANLKDGLEKCSVKLGKIQLCSHCSNHWGDRASSKYDGLKKAIHHWNWGRLSTFIVRFSGR